LSNTFAPDAKMSSGNPRPLDPSLSSASASETIARELALTFDFQRNASLQPAMWRMTMHFGATMWFTEYSISPGELAVALEQRGFESLWASEHSHVPMGGDPGPGTLRNAQADVMDPFVTLTAAAVNTKTLKLGTGICLLNQRDPIQTAKLVASLDRISGGRFLFGIGNGWHEEEMRNHGTVFGTRHRLVRERVEAMRAIWTQDEAEYHGTYVNFDPMITFPKPVQKPYPPVIVGGAYPYAARRAVRYGDGWYALTGAKYGDEFSFLPKFRDMLVEAGREPSTCPITICLYPEELDAFAPDQVGALRRYRDLGVVRCIVGLSPEKPDSVLPVLDRWTAFMRQLD
jgi:probable F420-dependent oxidoreductase